jgi:hypothetical protein
MWIRGPDNFCRHSHNPEVVFFHNLDKCVESVWQSQSLIQSLSLEYQNIFYSCVTLGASLHHLLGRHRRCLTLCRGHLEGWGCEWPHLAHLHMRGHDCGESRIPAAEASSTQTTLLNCLHSVAVWLSTIPFRQHASAYVSIISTIPSRQQPLVQHATGKRHRCSSSAARRARRVSAYLRYLRFN